MLFSSIPFLYYFLPLVLAVYFLVPRGLKNAVLFASSLLFYAWGEPRFCLFMLLSILQGYVFGRLIEKNAENRKWSKIFLTASVLLSLGLLGYCKYADFFISSVNAVTGSSLKLLHVALPIGISFYTFQILSYVVDVYRGDVPAQKSFLKLGTYIAMFPQLIAGPIVRYAEIAPQLDARETTLEDVSAGAGRFVIGLSKKVLLANVLYELITVFQKSRDLSVLFYWLYAVSFTLQLYFDFSGYTDLALGLALLFGFTLPENFNHPYMANSVTDFWRRWHMSLSSWFRDYVYIPLGGSRCSKGRLVWNLFAVWGLTGLWHGANWTFVCWGLWFFVLLSLEKLVWGQALAKLPGILRHVYAMLAVFIGWIFFRSSSLSYAFSFLRALFVPGMGAPDALSWLALCIRQYGVQLALCLLLSTNLGTSVWAALGKTKAGRAGRLLFLLVVLGLSVLSMAGSGMQAFIYAQF